MTKTEKLLRDLVALPSVNPAFLPAGHPRSGEKKAAEFLAGVAAKTGLAVAFQPALPNRENLLVTLEPRGETRQRVLLAPHLDTVGGADGQFTPVVRNGRLFGRGACDTKGSVAAMLQALCELAQCRQRPATTEIVFAGLVDEENAQAGSRALAASKFAAHLAIVGEATRSKVVTSHKGSLWIDLQTHGKSAHGARPELGKNAIHEMAKAVNIIQTEYAAGLKKRRHPHLGSATVSVGTIKGGVQPNIVPDSCSISLDRRTLPGETETGVFRELKSLLKRRGIGCSFSGTKLAPCLPLETDPKLPLVSQFMRAAGQRKPVGVDYFCDASVLSHGGIPSVVFGPGDIAQAHTTDEWIDLRSLENGKDLLFRFLSSLP